MDIRNRLPGRLALGASALFLGLAAAGCGETTGERAISGGALGAAGGAAGGALLGDAGTGALLGGAAGAATGALTDEEDLDLGEELIDLE